MPGFRSCSATPFGDGVQHVDAAEQCRRAAVRNRCDLPWLTLAAIEGAAEDVGLRAANRLHGTPEIGRGRLVGNVSKLSDDAPVLDPVELLPGELEVEALHVDRPGPITQDVDAPLDVADQLLGARPLRCRLK